MSEKLEMVLEVLDELADTRPKEFYHQLVFSLTSDADHAAEYINPKDLKILANFAEDVRILQGWDKEK